MYYSEYDTIDILATTHDLKNKDRYNHRNIIKGMCKGCGNATILKQQSRNEITVYCEALRVKVPTDIESCTSFFDPRTLSLHDMRQIAHIIEFHPKVGFRIVSPQERERERERERKREEA